jgi:hypothetical protein
MISHLAGRTACLFGFHHRSRSQAHDVDGHTESRCRYCQVPMERRLNDKWTVTRADH